jgi:tetratricopeptide (TPR) repeat protein
LFGALILGSVLGLDPSAAHAQGGRGAPTGDAPFILVTAFRTADGDKKLAVQAADAVRTRLGSVISSKELYVIPKSSIETYLEGSGYEKDVPLNAIDAKQLGQVLRADEVLIGTAAKTDAGFRFSGQIALTRDMAIRDNLPAGEGKTMTEAAADFARKIIEVRKQMPHERTCTNGLRDGKYDEAAAAAQKGIAAYPDAIISRICYMFALSQAKKAPDEVLAAANDVLSRDPRQPRALGISMDQFLIKGDTNNMARVASELVAVEAGNARLVEQIVTNLEAMRRADVALPILDKALIETPEDPDLMRLQFRLLIASGKWKDVIAKGELLAQVDTAAADQKYFERMAAAYQVDSQPQKAAEVLARGVSKFPEDPNMRLTLGGLLQSIGQLPQSTEVLRGALKIEPKLPNARFLIAQNFMKANQQDSALAILREAAAAGEDKAQVSGFALTMANGFLKTAQTSQTIEDARRVVQFASFADTVQTSVNSKFLLGVAQFFVAQAGSIGGGKAFEAKNMALACSLAKEGQAAIAEAQILIPQGGRVDPNTAGQLMQFIPQVSGSLDQQVPAYCK